MTFACITPALIVGGFAERMKFSAVVLFVVLWVTVVYFPIAHMVWDAGGLLLQLGRARLRRRHRGPHQRRHRGLVGAMMIGPRIGYRKELMPPHSLTLTMVGAGLLWVGWFGFNAGSALEANGIAALAMINTFVATAGATCPGCSSRRCPAASPRCSAPPPARWPGLVAVTPAAGFVGPVGRDRPRPHRLGLSATSSCTW